MQKKRVRLLLAAFIGACLLGGCGEGSEPGESRSQVVGPGESTQKEEEGQDDAGEVKGEEKEEDGQDPQGAADASGEASDGEQEEQTGKAEPRLLILKETTYYESGEKSVTKYEYDEAWNLLKEQVVDAGSKQYEYNDRGEKVKVTSYDRKGKEGGRTEYEYQAGKVGLLTRETVYGTNGDLLAIHEYQYDKDWRLIKKNSFRADHQLKSWVEYEYNKEGRLLREIEYQASGTINSGKEYTYDKEGRLKTTGFRNVLGDTSTTRYQYEFDDGGNPVKMTARSGGILYWIEYVYTSDGEGNLTGQTETKYDTDGRKMSVTTYAILPPE